MMIELVEEWETFRFVFVSSFWKKIIIIFLLQKKLNSQFSHRRWITNWNFVRFLQWFLWWIFGSLHHRHCALFKSYILYGQSKLPVNFANREWVSLVREQNNIFFIWKVEWVFPSKTFKRRLVTVFHCSFLFKLQQSQYWKHKHTNYTRSNDSLKLHLSSSNHWHHDKIVEIHEKFEIHQKC